MASSNQHSRADSPFYAPAAQDTSEGEGTAKPGWKLILTAREKGKAQFYLWDTQQPNDRYHYRYVMAKYMMTPGGRFVIKNTRFRRRDVAENYARKWFRSRTGKGVAI